MCGRVYQTYTDAELSFRYLNNQPLTLDLLPTYNLCPTETSPILRVAAGKKQFEKMRWQLVPATEPAFTTKLSTINARSENVFNSPVYRSLVSRQRCIVPLSGFFEWKQDGARKRPFKIHLRDEDIMSLAGIWDTWHAGTPEERRSFSILTTRANEFMSEIHNRMPVILGRSDEDAWLDPQINDEESVRRLFEPCPSEWLTAAEVSPLVNSPKNNSAAVLDPAINVKHSATSTGRLFDD
jgi:putative SOS response-associated peptidase YedK